MSTARILVPVDFSECSQELLERAAAIADSGNAELILLNVVVLPPDLDGKLPVIGADTVLTAHAHLVRTAAARLRCYESVVRQMGSRVRSHIATGIRISSIAAAIVRVARDLDADKIIMADSPGGGLRRIVLGTPADSIRAGARIPVDAIEIDHSPHCENHTCDWCAATLPEESRDDARSRAPLQSRWR